MRLLMVFTIAVFCLVACKSEDKSKSNLVSSSSDTDNRQISQQEVKAPIVDQSTLFSDNSDYQTPTSDLRMTTQDNQTSSNPISNPNPENEPETVLPDTQPPTPSDPQNTNNDKQNADEAKNVQRRQTVAQRCVS